MSRRSALALLAALVATAGSNVPGSFNIPAGRGPRLPTPTAAPESNEDRRAAAVAKRERRKARRLAGGAR